LITTVAEKVESGSSVHLPFEHLDPIDVPFDSTGTVRQSQSIQDRSVVGFEPSDEAAQVWKVIYRDG
jgi:hypothetical protein